MKLILHFIRKYPLSCILFAVIWYVSFFRPPKTQLDEIMFIDKIVHALMYGGTCMVLWLEYRFRHNRPDYEKLFFWAWLMPIIMSGTIELIQEYFTDGRRSGDWGDLAANATGVTLAAVMGWLMYRFFPKDRKGTRSDGHYNSDGHL